MRFTRCAPLLGLVLAACTTGGSSSPAGDAGRRDTGGGGPAAGSEGGPCYPNNTCNEALVCHSGECRGLPAGGLGGPCRPGGVCDQGLRCELGRCVPGAEGEGEGEGEGPGEGEGEGEGPAEGEGEGEGEGPAEGEGEGPAEGEGEGPAEGEGEGPPACEPGTLTRCEVECPEDYFAANCIRGGNPPLIQGIRRCPGGRRGPCEVNETCDGLRGPCENANRRPCLVPCLDGTSMDGTRNCFGALGAQCDESYRTGWCLPDDCPPLCMAGETCDPPGSRRACEVLCGGPEGRTETGEQSCQEFCGTHRRWGPCLTNNACTP